MEIPVTAAWYQYLDPCQRALIDTSLRLLDKKQELAGLPDYSFLVFPMAKTYEGFLKQIFFDLGLIDRQTFEGRRFRIGRALNPDIRNHQRDEDWLYDDVVRAFGEPIARDLWNVWLECRNHVFHYFPDCKQSVSWSVAEAKLTMMIDAMEAATTALRER